MKNYSILFKAEFKRFWTPAKIITAFGIIAVGSFVAFGMGSVRQQLTASNLLEMCYGIVSFFAILLFSAGIVGEDVKSGWLRTLLIRPVSREHYVVTKMLVVITAAMGILFITILLPVVYFTMVAETKIVFDGAATISFFLLKSGEVILFIIIATFISCWIGGAFNALALYIWFGASQMIEMFIAQKYWEVAWLMVLKEFLSPSGFQDAMNSIKMGSGFPAAEILWGVASAALFTALTIASINRIQIDNGSE